MAITINQYPLGTTIMPVFNPIEYDISSTNVAQTNFKFVCDIYAAGATVPIRLKQFPNPSNNYTTFDVSSAIKPYLTRNAWGYSDAGGFYDCSNSYNNFTIKFGEEYGASSAIVVYPNLTTDSARYALNGSFSFLDYIALHYKFYTLGTTARYFLTSKRSFDVTTTDKFQLYFANGNVAGQTAYNVNCKSYNSSGTLLQTLVFGTSLGTNNKMQRVTVGPYDLNNLTGGELRYSITTALPFVTSSVSYYDVYITESGGAQISEKMRFNVVDDCNPHTTVKLIFQNKYGAYDSFSFKNANDKKVSIQRSEYKKRLGAWNGTGFEYNYSDRGRASYNIVAQDSIHLRSEWITEAESTWLEELLTSPDVRIEDTTYADYVPVVITSSNYDYKKYSKDGLFNLELDIEYSFNRTRQQW